MFLELRSPFVNHVSNLLCSFLQSAEYAAVEICAEFRGQNSVHENHLLPSVGAPIDLLAWRAFQGYIYQHGHGPASEGVFELEGDMGEIVPIADKVPI